MGLVVAQNPILHQANRIVTVGLLQSYGRGGITHYHAPKPAPFSTSAAALDELDKVKPVLQTQPQLSFYKPNATSIEKGAAIQFKYSYTGKCVFVEAAKQKAAADKSGKAISAYDWDSKMVMKIYVQELGKMLTVLTGTESAAEFAHTNEKDGVKSFSSARFAKLDAKQYQMTISRKTGDDAAQLQVAIDHADAALLTEFIRCSIRSVLGFF